MMTGRVARPLFSPTPLAARASADGVTCSGATSVSIAVSWDTVPVTDLYYVAVAYAATARPFAIQTSAESEI